MSFKQLPGRATFKRVGRAFSYGLRMVAPGYGLRDLSRGKTIIENDLAKQKVRSKHSNFCCLKCGCHMRVPTLFTADAGQAYEMIKPYRIDRAFRIHFRSIEIICKKEDPTISCIHSSKAKARIGGRINDRLGDRSVLYLSKISHCMRSLAKLRWYKIGDKYLYQKVGMPIGGPVSGAILEA